jgi:hypothetical protein
MRYLAIAYVTIASALLASCGAPMIDSREHGTDEISVKLVNLCLQEKRKLLESKTVDEKEIDVVVMMCALAQHPFRGKDYYKQEPWKWPRHAEEAHNKCTFYTERFSDLISKKEPLTTSFLFTYSYECEIARMYY